MTTRLRDAVGRRLAEVVRAEVERSGAAGVVVASPPDPALPLLRSWLTASIPFAVPEADEVALLGRALASLGTPPARIEALSWRGVAEVRAEAEGLVPIGATNKTSLLLDDAPLPARVLPLADLWATQLRAWCGDAVLPPVLAGRPAADVVRVESALAAYLEGGVGPDAAFGALGALGDAVRRALDAAEGRRRGLLVPKIHAWTAGTDLAR